jgi:hypothetical protein
MSVGLDPKLGFDAIKWMLGLASSAGDKHTAAQRLAADRIRSGLLDFTREIRSIEALLGSGVPQIVAARRIVDEARCRLPEGATGKDLEKALSDDSIALSVAVNGWDQSRYSAQLAIMVRRAVDLSTDALFGLPMFVRVAEMVRRIIDDACLTCFMHATGIALRVVPIAEKVDFVAALNALTTRLQSDVCAYYRYRYFEAMRTIVAFTEGLATALVSLKDGDLIEVRALGPAHAVDFTTFTLELKNFLVALKEQLKPETLQDLGRLLAEMGHSLSKEAAMASMKAAGGKSGDVRRDPLPEPPGLHGGE